MARVTNYYLSLNAAGQVDRARRVDQAKERIRQRFRERRLDKTAG